MVKHTQTIRRQEPTNCLSVLDHFAGLALKGLYNHFFQILNPLHETVIEKQFKITITDEHYSPQCISEIFALIEISLC